MNHLSLDNDPSLGFDTSTSLILAKPAPLSFDLSDLLNSKISYTPSSQSTYDSISIKAEEDIFRPISNGDHIATKEFQDLATIGPIPPKKFTLGDYVTKRPYNKRPKNTIDSNETKKEPAKRKRVANKAKDSEDTVVKKEKLLNGVCREVAVSTCDPGFPEIVLKDGKIQVANSNASQIAGKTSRTLEVVQLGKKKITTSISFKQVNHTEKWTEPENEKFYRALELFGTEFSMIAKVFKNRDRNQIKNKFLREEKMFPEKVNSALSGPGGTSFHTLLQKFNKLQNSQQSSDRTLDKNPSANLLMPHIKQDNTNTTEIAISHDKRERSDSIDSIDRAIMEDLSDIFVPQKSLLNI